jgi:hypothetical protein
MIKQARMTIIGPKVSDSCSFDKVFSLKHSKKEQHAFSADYSTVSGYQKQ